MKTASLKAKGRALQKWVAERVGTVLSCKHGYEDDCPVQPRLMGQGGTDIVLRGEARRFPFDIECKAVERFDINGTIRQAKANSCEDDRHWLVVWKRNRQAPVVVLDAELFFQMCESLETGEWLQDRLTEAARLEE